MQSHFATKSRNLHLNPGANGDAIGSPFKCKSAFRKSAWASAGSKPPYEPYTREIWPGGTLQEPWGGSHVRRCVALCLIGADDQHQGEADLFPGKGGELWASLWQEA